MFSKMYIEQPEVMWTPKKDSGLKMKEFQDIIREKYHVKIDNYWDLHKWSTENYPEFWGEIWDFVGIIHSKMYDKVIDRDAKSADRPVWFQGALLNYAENVMKYRDDRVALIAAGEDRLSKMVTFAEMYQETCLYRAALKKLGIKKGDCTACYMSNREEPIYAMLGASSIGATWTGALPLLGAKAVINRFRLTHPKILFTLDRFKNDGEEKEMLEKVKEIADGLSCLEKVVIVPTTPESKLKDISGIKNSCFLDEFLELGRNKDGSVPPMEFEQLPFDHPVFISYTSGTTGNPKALVHGIGGLVSEARDFLLHNDCRRENVFLSMSPVGWASWNLFITLLALGVAVLLFEGVPYFLSPTHFWDMVDEFKISNLFLTPSVLDELDKRNYLPTSKNHLNSLEAIFSGASVVKPQNYEFVYKKIKPDVQFGSCYGSTEVMGATIIFDCTLPIHKGEISAPSFGCKIECFNDSGQSVVGEPGEIVFTIPIPSLALGLVEDPDGTKYREVYCSKFPGHFCSGDIGLINPVTKGFIIFGRRKFLAMIRSDVRLQHHCASYNEFYIYHQMHNRVLHCMTHAIIHKDLPTGKNCPYQIIQDLTEQQMKMRVDDTMKPKGARFGCVEIYNVVDMFEEVFESLCVSQYNANRDERAVLFIKVKDGYKFTEKLVKRMRLAIENELTKRHVPEIIIEVKDVPKNMNGKKMEILVKKIINNMPYNPETVINPESLVLYQDVPELRGF